MKVGFNRNCPAANLFGTRGRQVEFTNASGLLSG